MCFACIGLNHQNTKNQNQKSDQKSCEPSDKTSPSNISTTQNKDTSIIMSDLRQSDCVKDTTTTNNLPTTNTQPDLAIKLKDLRQLEQKLKKKEEQLKIKEAMLNDDSKEREKILDRLFKAESRNNELVQTVNTLTQRISMLEGLTDQSSNKFQKTAANSVETNSTDELIIGLRDKVTRFVLTKIDRELDALLKQENRDVDRTTVLETNENPTAPRQDPNITQKLNPRAESNNVDYVDTISSEQQPRTAIRRVNNENNMNTPNMRNQALQEGSSINRNVNINHGCSIPVNVGPSLVQKANVIDNRIRQPIFYAPKPQPQSQSSKAVYNKPMPTTRDHFLFRNPQRNRIT